jgi:hypothetical protein
MPAPPTAECRLPDRGGRQVDTRGADARVAQLAARDWGVLSSAELREAGLSDRQIATRVRDGRLHRWHRGVYAVGHTNLTLQGRFFAAVKASGPDAVVSHVAAAALHGLLEWDHRPVDVSVAGPGSRVHAGISAHRPRALAAGDRTRVQGIPVTSVARTVVDCAASLEPRALRRLVRESQGRQLVALPQIAATLLRLRPRRGSRRLRGILATGPAPTRSELEDIVLDLILGAGLVHPDVNAPLDIGGRVVRPDFRWPEQRLVVEADGGAWHDHALAREDDAERQAALEAHGERVIRVSYRQAVGQPAQTLARIRAAGAPHASSVDLPTAAVDKSTVGA